jgi:MFS family permease
VSAYEPPEILVKLWSSRTSSAPPVSAFAGDAVTGFVAGVGAGGIAAMRADLAPQLESPGRRRLVVCAYVFILARSATIIALLLAPVLPFTSIGVADHLSERRRSERHRPDRRLVCRRSHARFRSPRPR